MERTKTGIETKKQFVGLGKADEEMLKELKDLVGERVDELVDAFYQHLTRFKDTESLLRNEEVRARLKMLQREYLLTLFGGPYDQTYFASRRRIGKAHNRLQLSPEYYLGSYVIYSTVLYPLIIEKYRNEPDKLQRALLAMVKVISLDEQIAMETYIESYLQKLEFINRELERMNTQLEETVEDRTRQLRNFEEKLRHIERLVLLGTLASGIAHEVGTPLNIISGRVEMLAARAQNDVRVGKDLTIINQQIERITKIIRELLNVARQKPSQAGTVDLRSLVSDLLEFLRIAIEKSGVQVTVNIREEASSVTGDKDQLQQLFMNLVVNAIQAMPQSGKLTIDSSLRFRDGTNYVVVDVRDTGVGIPEELLDKIFDSFFSTKSQGEGGTGLGLSIAKDIARKHGGDILVQSRVGEGSTFSILLPERLGHR